MDFWEVVSARHSVRDFNARPVPRELVERALAAASQAPSAANSQPWYFHVCTGAIRHEVGHVVAQATVHLAEYMDVLGPRRYEDAMRWYSSLGDAPMIIAVSMARSESEFDELNKLLSVGAAIENLLLSCTALGLGACNITFAQYVKGEIASLLQLDESRDIVALVAVGYASDVPPAVPPRSPDYADWLE